MPSISEISAYLKDELSKVRISRNKPVREVVAVNFALAGGGTSCDLCGRLFEKGTRVLVVKFNTMGKDSTETDTCVDLEVCQVRRNSASDEAAAEQREIEHLVRLPKRQ